MRNVVSLDSATVAATAARAIAERRGARNRMGTLVLLPFLGLAPAKVQKRWHSDWLFPADAATWASSVLEFLVAHDVFLILSGSLRLLSARGGRPMGSLFGWVLRPLYRSSLTAP